MNVPLKTKEKTALVFGATGLVGNELSNLLLYDDHYDLIKVFVRKEMDLEHPKLVQVITSLENPEEIASEIKGDDLYCCLGTTKKKAGSREAFAKVDLDLPLKIAEIAGKNQVRKFIVVSSIGAKPNSRNFYLRTKGKMEQAILGMNFENICIVRPSILLGQRKESRFGEEAGKVFVRIFSFMLNGPLKKYKGIHAQTVARAMIRLANTVNNRVILESHKLQEMGRLL
jgi:uncharacterized protein YbjT (DUF2867 family)